MSRRAADWQAAIAHYSRRERFASAGLSALVSLLTLTLGPAMCPYRLGNLGTSRAEFRWESRGQAPARAVSTCLTIASRTRTSSM